MSATRIARRAKAWRGRKPGPAERRRGKSKRYTSIRATIRQALRIVKARQAAKRSKFQEALDAQKGTTIVLP